MRNANVHILQHVRPIDNPMFGIIEVVAVAGALFLGALVRIPLPWTPVPITLQTVPVLTAAYIVGRDRAALGIGLYLLLGICQAGYQASGISMFAAVFGPSAGYLAAFALVPFITSSIRGPGRAIVVATLSIDAAGTSWLCVWQGIGPIAGFMSGVLPFIPGDFVKGFAAYLVARRIPDEPKCDA